MPFRVPPYVQYQDRLQPLRNIWRVPPAEGDKFVTVSIEWGVTTGANRAVQVALGDIATERFSQIAAINVDNTRCAVECVIAFPDTGALLVVPPFTQGLYPVFTNSLTFYVSATGADIGNQTVLQVCNSVPPPVAVQNQRNYQARNASGASLANGTVQVVPATISGTLRSMSINVFLPVAPGTGILSLRDGTNAVLWNVFLFTLVETQAIAFSMSDLSLRFTNGIQSVITSSTIAGGSYNFNLYFETL